MPFTVRVVTQVRGTKRITRQFVRPEYAINTSSHATVFDTREDAERAADQVSDYARAAGHTVIGADFYQVGTKGGR